MQIELFYKKINDAVREFNSFFPEFNQSSAIFLKYLDDIFKNMELDSIHKLTQISILFEGFYCHLPDQSPLKKNLTNIRLERWENHYGTPTITFLLTFHSHINQTIQLFQQLQAEENFSLEPWRVMLSQDSFTLDFENGTLVDKQSIATVKMPSKDEQTGQFLNTHNPSGGFTTTPCDPVSQKFIEYASEVAKKDGVVLEIGAAFGAATLKALAQGATVFCNDIYPSNLAVVRNRYLKAINSQESSVTGDENKLVLVPGEFPSELAELPKNFFDAILICRVLHFFTGDLIEKSLQQLSVHLKPGGKLFVVCETPFLKNWLRFMPEYEKRIKEGVKWPGEIHHPAVYESSGRAASLPKFVHWMSKEILERSFVHSKFDIEHSSYIDRKGQFPADLLWDGRESIGVIGVKPY